MNRNLFSGEIGQRLLLVAKTFGFTIFSQPPVNQIGSLIDYWSTCVASWFDANVKAAEMLEPAKLVPLVVENVLLAGLALWLGYSALKQIGLFGVEVVSQGRLEKVDTLILTVSRTTRDYMFTSKDEQNRKRDALRAAARGELPIRSISNSAGDMVLGFDAMTRIDTSIITPRGEAISLTDFAWQQSWRTIREQLRGEDRKLSRIILIQGESFQHGEGVLEFEDYRTVLAAMLEAEGVKNLTVEPAKTDDDSLAGVQALYKRLNEEQTRKANKGRKVGIDITSGDRIFAFAAATAALGRDTYMFYVSGAESDGDKAKEEPVVQCFDIRPELQNY
jgi:hypothetical protein